MDTEQYIIQVLGRNGLTKISDDESLALLPPRARRFAKDIGLPKEEILLTRFRCPKLLSPIGGERFTLIATLESAVFAIGEDDSVWCISPESDGRHEITHVNTGLEQLVGCLAAYGALPDLCLENPEIVDHHGKVLEDRIKEIDGVVLGHTDNWWAQVLEQVRHGLL